MSITLPTNPEAEKILRDAFGDKLEQLAYEALVIKAYQDGRIGTYGVAKLVGLEDRWQGDRWLGERGIPMNYGAKEFEEDMEAARRLGLLPERRQDAA